MTTFLYQLQPDVLGIQFTEKPTCDALVEQVGLERIKAMGEQAMFITINPNPRAVINVQMFEGKKFKEVKKRYRDLSYDLQYRYLLDIVKLYMNFLIDPFILGTWEIGGSENTLHAHFVCYDPSIKTEYHIKGLRNSLRSDPAIFKHLTTGGRDYMNNIVYINDSMVRRCQYMDKDHAQKVNMFPNYYVIPDWFTDRK